MHLLKHGNWLTSYFSENCKKKKKMFRSWWPCNSAPGVEDGGRLEKGQGSALLLGGRRTSSILRKWVWAGCWHCITLLPPQGVSGTGFSDAVCGIVNCQLPWSPSSFLTFWLPVWPGSVPGEARLSASPGAMWLCNKEEAIPGCQCHTISRPSFQRKRFPSLAWAPPWLVKQPSP